MGSAAAGTVEVTGMSLDFQWRLPFDPDECIFPYDEYPPHLLECRNRGVRVRKTIRWRTNPEP